MEPKTYPNIVLSTDNPEIHDCALFPAFVGLFAEFLLKDGSHFPYAEVLAYDNGAFVIAVGDGVESYSIIAPVESIATITYI